ncbi:MAG: TraR/DksA family transcriptional regulator [Alphaproteobacteria bacterium]
MAEIEDVLVAELRQQMEDELAELTELHSAHMSDRSPVSLDQQSVGRVSRIDAMQRQAMAIASGNRRTARIEALKAALRRAETSEYGYCAICGEPIAIGRLKADPTAYICIACAHSTES